MIFGDCMLSRLNEIADKLDKYGMYKEADVITNVMKRIAFLDNEPMIREFNQDGTEMLQIHSTLRNAGIDPSGLDDDTARSIYEQITRNNF